MFIEPIKSILHPVNQLNQCHLNAPQSSRYTLCLAEQVCLDFRLVLPCASAPQELTHKGCGDASMRKRRAQATSVKHGEKRKWQPKQGQIEQSLGDLCVRGGCAGNVCLKKNPEMQRTSPQDDHITREMNAPFV